MSVAITGVGKHLDAGLDIEVELAEALLVELGELAIVRELHHVFYGQVRRVCLKSGIWRVAEW